MIRREAPTLAQLRARVQKARHREIGNWLARRVARPTAVYGTWLAVRLGLSANQITAASWIGSMASAIAIGWGTRAAFVAGVSLAHLAFWLDHVDGQVARWRRTNGLDGTYLDYLMHHAANLATGFALGYGLASRSGDPRWSIAGILIAGGWAMLGLHNDCRYKAFFQRLKAGTASYRVDAGSGGRPAPPAPWPRRGLGMLTWPAYKAFEPHVILIGMTGMAVAAVVAPPVWSELWRWGVMAMAILAPMLAIARIARAVNRGAAEAEFDRWFQPIEWSRADSSANPAAATPTPGHRPRPIVATNEGGPVPLSSRHPVGSRQSTP